MAYDIQRNHDADLEHGELEMEEEDAGRTIVDEVLGALASGEISSWRLTRLDGGGGQDGGTIELLMPGDAGATARYLVRVQQRPLALFDPATGAIICPHCRRTSLDGIIELRQDQVPRYQLIKVEGATAVFSTEPYRFDEDEADTRLGCSSCGLEADLPPDLDRDWVYPDGVPTAPVEFGQVS